MIFAKLDVTLRDHAKLLKAIKRVGWGALGVYAWAMMYLRASETEDGILADDVVDLSMPNQKDTKKIIDALVDVGLLVRREGGGGPGGGGYYLDKYETKNETKAVINERRAATLARVTRYRDGRNAVTGASVTPLHPPTQNAFVPGSDSLSDSVLDKQEGMQGEAPPAAKPKQPGALGMEIETFRLGVVDGSGSPCASFNRFALEDITRGIAAHAPKCDTAEQLLAWLRGSAAEFARAYLAIIGTNFHPGNHPSKWVAWLDKGRPVAVAGGAPARPEPPKPPSHTRFTPMRRGA